MRAENLYFTESKSMTFLLRLKMKMMLTHVLLFFDVFASVRALSNIFNVFRSFCKKIMKSVKFDDFRDFEELQRFFPESTVFCENVALAARRPSKTTNKPQGILGIVRRERRGRRFRAKILEIS